MTSPSALIVPLAMPSLSLRSMTRVKSTVYSTSLTFGVTMPVNFTSPTPSARPRPCMPRQPRLKPVSCQSASSPRQPGITGSPRKWHWKNQRSGRMSNSATTWPLPSPPRSAEMSVMRSIISIGGAGSCGLPGPNISPRAQASSPS